MEQIVIEYRPGLFFPPRTGPWIVGKITLIPGVKGYPLVDWEEINTNSRLKAVIDDAIANNILRIISQSSPKVEIPSLPKNQQEAIVTVGKTYSLSLLKDWQTVEKRKVVLDAIAEQIAKGEAPTDKKEGTKTETSTKALIGG